MHDKDERFVLIIYYKDKRNSHY